MVWMLLERDLRILVRLPDGLIPQLIPMARTLARTSQNGSRGALTTANDRADPRDDHDPVFRGHGSYFDEMAEREGFEPSRQVNPAHAISSRAP